MIVKAQFPCEYELWQHYKKIAKAQAIPVYKLAEDALRKYAPQLPTIDKIIKTITI